MQISPKNTHRNAVRIDQKTQPFPDGFQLILVCGDATTSKASFSPIRLPTDNVG